MFVRCSLFLVVAAASACGQPDGPTSGIAITNVRVFDGQQRLPHEVTIVIENDAVTHVGAEFDSSRFATIVDGRGKFAMPGLLDAHVHAADGSSLMSQQLAFGAMTSMGMYTIRRSRESSVPTGSTNPSLSRLALARQCQVDMERSTAW
jgi:imidazolonepropionase-like amidohydrolase